MHSNIPSSVISLKYVRKFYKMLFDISNNETTIVFNFAKFFPIYIVVNVVKIFIKILQ